MDPYASGMFKANPYAEKTDVKGELVVVLRGKYPQRGLQLIKPKSRAVNLGEVHELIITDQQAQPGDKVDPIAYLGFFAITAPGILVTGDRLKVAGKEVGMLSGFDETHMPNHLNIIVSGERISGEELGLELGADVVFQQGEY
ncbi:MAG: hypothetical protein FH749_04960 [Firmicutes bacterium]|nr:hypothetical protein [Bacillota bacterium]